MRKGFEYGVVFVIGAMGYALVELLWRGRTHWTMMLTGGTCLSFIYLTERRYGDAPRWKRCLVGAQVITLFELAVGFLVNVLLGWAVWDYSRLPLNLFGQICPRYCALWFLLCLPVTGLCTWLERIFDGILQLKKKRLPM